LLSDNLFYSFFNVTHNYFPQTMIVVQFLKLTLVLLLVFTGATSLANPDGVAIILNITVMSPY
jgi:hypothetical protein